MFYSPDTIFAVYTMSEKVLDLCKHFLVAQSYKIGERQQNPWGIGYHFEETDGRRRHFFVGITPTVPLPYVFSVALNLNTNDGTPNEGWYTDDENWAYFQLDREILAKDLSEEVLQATFNKCVEDILAGIQ